MERFVQDFISSFALTLILTFALMIVPAGGSERCGERLACHGEIVHGRWYGEFW
jgi:hypothetical protein